MKEERAKTVEDVQKEYNGLYNQELIFSQIFAIFCRRFGYSLVNDWLQTLDENHPFLQNLNKKPNRRTQKPVLIEERFQELQKQTEYPDITVAARFLFHEYPVSDILQFLINKK